MLAAQETTGGGRQERMISCKRCGHSNDTGSRFCVGCGSQLDSAESLPPGAHSVNPVAISDSVSSNPGRYGDYTPASPSIRQADFVDSLAFAATTPPELHRDQAWAMPLDRPGQVSQRPLTEAPAATAAGDATVSIPYREPYDVRVSINPAEVSPDAPPVLAGFLVSYDANPLGQSWPVIQGPNNIGRASAGADADIELQHATVSSRHAVLLAAATPGRMLLIDQASTNGTFVNETALVPDQQWPLRDGDVVRFGLFKAIVKIVC
jgi:FHA domain